MKLILALFILAVLAFSATVFVVRSDSKSDHFGPTITVQSAEHLTQLHTTATNAFGEFSQQGKALPVDSESNMVSVQLNKDDTNFFENSDLDSLDGNDSRSEILSDLVKKPARSFSNTP